MTLVNSSSLFLHNNTVLEDLDNPIAMNEYRLNDFISGLVPAAVLRSRAVEIGNPDLYELGQHGASFTRTLRHRYRIADLLISCSDRRLSTGAAVPTSLATVSITTIPGRTSSPPSGFWLATVPSG